MNGDVADSSAYRPIGDYALIGDCRSAALVSRTGSIDWLCWPQFDSPSVFAALLDAEHGGCFQIQPATDGYDVDRSYRDDTCVLETTFSTDGAVLRLTDWMPVRPTSHRVALWPQREVLRRLECLEGEGDVVVRCAPRPGYARRTPRLARRGELGFFWDAGDLFVLRSDFPLEVQDDEPTVAGTHTLHEGDTYTFSFTFSNGVAVFTPLEEAADRLVSTCEYWQDWVGQCRYEGTYGEAVRRSALTLKLLTFSASGAIVAAPTTSLPEEIGGVRNWDYRYCWLRDASLTLSALYDLGYDTEGRAFMEWMLHATHLTHPDLQVLYSVYGETHLVEEELEHLEGYRQSQPVRIGNAADRQFQLDTWGEVVEAMYRYVQRGGELSRPQSDFVVRLGKKVMSSWEEPDEGVWELRAERQDHTYSKAMCWIAVDRVLRLYEDDALHTRMSTDRWEEHREAIREAIEEHGYNEAIGSYTSSFDGDDVDASLLLLAIHGYAEAASDRMTSTADVLRERLGRDGLLMRYCHDDGLPGEEGAFGICSFWMVEYEARRGDTDRAAEHFEELLGYANDVGLFAEEIDPESGEALGNFPQAFTHVGLINAAVALAEARGRDGDEAGDAAQQAEAA